MTLGCAFFAVPVCYGVLVDWQRHAGRAAGRLPADGVLSLAVEPQIESRYPWGTQATVGYDAVQCLGGLASLSFGLQSGKPEALTNCGSGDGRAGSCCRYDWDYYRLCGSGA